MIPGTHRSDHTVYGNWWLARVEHSSQSSVYYVRPALGHIFASHPELAHKHKYHILTWSVSPAMERTAVPDGALHDDVKWKAYNRFKGLFPQGLPMVQYNNHPGHMILLTSGPATNPYQPVAIFMTVEQFTWLKFFVACWTGDGLCIPETDRNPEGFSQWCLHFCRMQANQRAREEGDRNAHR